MIIEELTDKPRGKVLAMDASTNALAFSVFAPELTHYGKLFVEGEDFLDKCGDASRKMSRLMEVHKPDVFAIESAVYVNNRQVVVKLAYVYGAAIGIASAAGCRCVEISPATWMNYIGNPTRDTNEFKQAVREEFPAKKETWIKNELRKRRKQRTIDWVNNTYGVTVEDNDVADAIGIGYYVTKELM